MKILVTIIMEQQGVQRVFAMKCLDAPQALLKEQPALQNRNGVSRGAVIHMAMIRMTRNGLTKELMIMKIITIDIVCTRVAGRCLGS